MRVVVFHWRLGNPQRADPPLPWTSAEGEGNDCNEGCARTSHLFYTSHVSPQCQTRVKLNRVFFPRCVSQARSPACGFARQ